MASGAYATTIVLQDAQDEAADGVAVNIDGLTSLLVQVSGTFANVTANWEASADGGVTWAAVALLPLGSTTPGTLVLTATAVGWFRLTDARGLTHFRARTTIGAATGGMTVRVYGVRSQVQFVPD